MADLALAIEEDILFGVPFQEIAYKHNVPLNWVIGVDMSMSEKDAYIQENDYFDNE
jgi:hypothetical protein